MYTCKRYTETVRKKGEDMDKKNFEDILKTEYSERFDEIRKKNDGGVVLQIRFTKRKLRQI